jgi:hypothetical protein
MNCNDHYEQLYGNLGLHPKDAARWVFASGWNSALEEVLKRVNAMPFGDDTKASFAVYFQQLMNVDPGEIVERMQ